MPFKSQAQRRFMFAAEDRSELPKGTAKRWADHTKSIKSLPEHVKQKKQKKEAHLKLAFLLGQKMAMEEAGVKTAGAESLIGNVLMRSAHLWGPAGAGAALAGPDYRTEGAMLGLGAGALGKNLGRYMLRGSKFTPEELKALKPVWNSKTTDSAFKSFAESNKDLASKYEEYLGQLTPAEWAGRIGGGVAAGMMVPKLVSPSYPNPYARMGQSMAAPPQFMSPPLPAVNDISGHYSGVLPEGMAY